MKTWTLGGPWRARFTVLSAGLGVGLGVLASTALAQTAAEAKSAEDQRYAEGLVRLGLPEYADLVLKGLGNDPATKALRLESSLQRGEFEKVIGIIAAEPDQNAPATWAMRATLANGYFAWGKYAEARKIYDEFFAKYSNGGPPPELKQFYYNAAYTFAQMLQLMGDTQAAIKAYRFGLIGSPDRDTKRQIQGDLADLLMKLADASAGGDRDKYLAEADQIADELLWIQDIWFGKAIVLKAHNLMLKGDIDGAMALVDDYTDTLQSIEQQLQAMSTPTEDLTRLSPMAEARYLLGSIELEEAKRALAKGDKAHAMDLLAGKQEQRTGKAARQLPGATKHFLNVFVRYPNTKWAADAGARFEETLGILKNDLGKQVKFEVPAEAWRKVEEAQLKEARAAFNLQQFEPAAEQYQKVLARFPEGENAVGALSDLATCYIELNNDLYADTVIDYMAERFSHNKRVSQQAGNAVLSLATSYGERKHPERKEAVYEVFFKHFTEHPLTARLLASAGDKCLTAGDLEGARKYYERVVREHARNPIVFDAQSKIATTYERSGDVTNQVRSLETYVSLATNNNARLDHSLIRNLYRLASAQRKLGNYPAAVKRYSEIEQRLSAKRDAYEMNSTETETNQGLLEAALFYKAACFARAVPPKDKPETLYKQNALQFFLQLADKYPQSKLTPAALSQAGTLWTVLGNAGEAQKAFNRLKQNYGESPEAKNVDFLLGMSLLELGKRNEAVAVFKQMFSGGGQYSDAQILTAGDELLKAKEYAIAIEAFDRVLSTAKPDERGKIEPALAGKGRALVLLGKYPEGAATLEDLFKRYPKSAFTVESSYALSKAYAEQAAVEKDGGKRFDLFNESIKAMKNVVARDTSVERRGDVQVQVGRISELKAKSEADNGGTPEKVSEYRDQAIATYQAMILFEDAKDQKIRPYLEEAYHRCLALFLESERWQDLYNDASGYLSKFPNGKYLLEARQWRSQANARLAAQGENMAAPAGAPTATPAPAPETATPGAAP
ncbi:MAG: tetratricopeptide repeat protein [Lentisphaerae bacterium]|nr:tetratricopeptide repeat protein [Lentisphaerota bacterium]